jgi:hypothetical protein
MLRTQPFTQIFTNSDLRLIFDTVKSEIKILKETLDQQISDRTGKIGNLASLLIRHYPTAEQLPQDLAFLTVSEPNRSFKSIFADIEMIANRARDALRVFGIYNRSLGVNNHFIRNFHALIRVEREKLDTLQPALNQLESYRDDVVFRFGGGLFPKYPDLTPQNLEAYAPFIGRIFFRFNAEHSKDFRERCKAIEQRLRVLDLPVNETGLYTLQAYSLIIQKAEAAIAKFKKDKIKPMENTIQDYEVQIIRLENQNKEYELRESQNLNPDQQYQRALEQFISKLTTSELSLFFDSLDQMDFSDDEKQVFKGLKEELVKTSSLAVCHQLCEDQISILDDMIRVSESKQDQLLIPPLYAETMIIELYSFQARMKKRIENPSPDQDDPSLVWDTEAGFFSEAGQETGAEASAAPILHQRIA